VQFESLEGPEDFVGGPGSLAGRIEVLDADQPGAAVAAGIEEAADGSDQ